MLVFRYHARTISGYHILGLALVSYSLYGLWRVESMRMEIGYLGINILYAREDRTMRKT